MIKRCPSGHRFYKGMTLENLTEQERQIALQILKDTAAGNKSTYEQLLYADYEEIPVDIETFLTDDRYLGAA